MRKHVFAGQNTQQWKVGMGLKQECSSQAGDSLIIEWSFIQVLTRLADKNSIIQVISQPTYNLNNR